MCSSYPLFVRTLARRLDGDDEGMLKQKGGGGIRRRRRSMPNPHNGGHQSNPLAHSVTHEEDEGEKDGIRHVGGSASAETQKRDIRMGRARSFWLLIQYKEGSLLSVCV